MLLYLRCSREWFVDVEDEVKQAPRFDAGEKGKQICEERVRWR